ncbi:MAG: alpha/beta hydrolase [Ktedonobacterales bacterium]
MNAADILLGRPSPHNHDRVPTAGMPAGPPSGAGALRELTGVVQVARLIRAAPWLLRAPRGDGGRVIDLPGWKAPEASNVAIRRWLRWLGYDARPWGLGTNVGNPERDVETLVTRLQEAPGDGQVALVGWSLGGLVAREVARAVPERVSRVITYGTPVIGGPTYTLGASSYGREQCEHIEVLAARLDAENPIQVPITAIYTRRDGVVDWRACIDRTSPNVLHVEVRATHLSLGIDPDVWWAIATALAKSHPAQPAPPGDRR